MLVSLYLRCVLVVSLAGHAYALDPGLRISQYQKRHWQVEDGLPHNYVMAIMPAPDRYLLVATDEGLARFDGLRFQLADLDPSLGLSKRWVLSMMAARDGSLWFGTFDGGLYQWRGGHILRRVEHGASIFAILEDPQGHIWASTRNGVIRSSGNQFEPVPQLAPPPDTAWNVLTLDRQGAVWIVTADGLYRAMGDTISRVAASGAERGEFLSVLAGPDGSLNAGTSRGLLRILPHSTWLQPVSGVSAPVVALLYDRHHNLWAGTWGKGLLRISSSGVEAWTAANGLPDDFIRTLYEDSEGNLWIGVRAGGLSRWTEPSVVPYGIPEGLAGDFATTVTQDPRGGLWLGTWRSGLYVFRNGTFLRQPTPIPMLLFSVRTLAIDPHGNPWIGNWEGLYRYDGHRYQHWGGSGAPFHQVSAIAFDRRNRLWVGTSGRGLFLFPSADPAADPAAHLLPGQEITSLHEDSQGNLWVGTPSGAGWIPPGGDPLFHPVAAPRDSIVGLSEDARQRVWACTLGGALWLLSPSGVKVIDSRHGLPGHPLYRALDDRTGSLWVSSPRGILRLSIAQLDAVVQGNPVHVDAVLYNQDDGLRTIECHRLSQPAGGLDRDGSLWFPTSKGFVRIHPSRTRNDAPLNPVIEASSADLQLAPGSHDLQLRFTAFRFSAAAKIRFRYLLEGYDPDWVADTGSRLARYTRIPPGDYRFLVSASLPGGDWSAPAAITVHQAPLFHQTRWFLLLLALATLAVATALFRWRVHIIRQRYSAVIAERNRIAREWHDTLVAGFSAISLQLDAALFRLGDQPTPARDVIEVTRKIVHHYRAEARRVIWDLRDSRPDSESLTDALRSALQQAVDGKGIDGSLTVTGDPVPAPRDLEHNLLRICQEALSNAIRHGHPATLKLDVSYSGERLQVRIADDGCGFEPVELRGLNTGHFGLTVMEERARRFGGTFHLESSPGHGTVVLAAIPLRHE